MTELSVFIVVCWVIFWIYWLISAVLIRGGPITGGNNFIRIRLVMLVVIILISRSLTGRSYFSNQKFLFNVHNTALETLGTVIFLSGLLLAIWARINLGKNWGTPMTERKNPRLITSGPYKYVRHPIYTGILLGFLGSALAVGFVWLLIFIFSGIYFFYSSKKEEQYMLQKFPEVYAKYMSTTKMYLPFII